MDGTDVVRIFDTTLRDGEQSPGATLNIDEKLEIARQLARLGVDIIEAGFPIASPGDFEAVRRVAREVGQLENAPAIAGLARCNKADIDRAWEAVREAKRPRIHTFLATSDIHLQYKLKISREECLKRVAENVAYARSLCADIEFSPEDGGRSDPEFLYQVLDVAIRAGATTLNIPDTVGYTTPAEFGGLIRGIRENVPGVQDVIISAHCHDDLGLATANSLAAIQNGARQVEVTINGIGERAGNTSLEEIVMALHTRPHVYGLRTNIDTTQIMRTSRLVSAYTGMVVQPNKAIVGANAFAHEAGIHQDGMMKNPLTYEIMQPETVGLTESKLVLGKHSGRHAFQSKVAGLGYDLSAEELNRVLRSLQGAVRQEEGRRGRGHRSDRQRRDLPADGALAAGAHPGFMRDRAAAHGHGAPARPRWHRARGRGDRRRPCGLGLQGDQPHHPGAQRADRIQHQGGHRGDRRGRRSDHPHRADGGD